MKTNCSSCGAVIERKPFELLIRRNHFCNHRCKAEWQSKQPPEAHPRWNKERSNATCDQCGKPIWVRPSKLKRDKYHFCSKEHADAFKTGKPLYQPPRPARPEKSKKFPVQCHYCGKTFMIQPSRIREQKHIYCGFECRGKWRSENQSGENSSEWRGGSDNYYGPNWQQQRRAARKRDKYTCQGCGITEKQLNRELDVHHKKQFKSFGYVVGENEKYIKANQLSNLVSLCSLCHRKTEPRKLPFQIPMFVSRRAK